MLVLNILVAILLSIDQARANDISCTAPEQCQNSILNCVSNEDCFISCTGRDSCRNSTFNCPSNGNCNIQCRGSDSCWDSIINATASNGNLDLLCESLDDTTFDDQCRNIQVYGSTVDTNTGDVSVICNGDLRSCVSSSIYCAVSGRCSITCNASSSCRWMTAYGPTNYDFIVDCNEDRSCFDAVIDGRYSSSMDITGCTAYESCLDITLYCPPSVNNDKKCFIEGNNNLGQDKYIGGTYIYAVHGWNDIYINYSGNYYQNATTSDYYHGGKMFCGTHYNHSCNIAFDGWYCENIDDYCNDISSNTNIPTQSPTSEPTIVPTTIPTLYPTKSPTKLPIYSARITTVSPTQLPSSIPTQLPTDLPSKPPTYSPTKFAKTTSDLSTTLPTNNPTQFPSKRPTYSPSFSSVIRDTVNQLSSTDYIYHTADTDVSTFPITDSITSYEIVQAADTEIASISTTMIIMIIALSVLCVINIVSIVYCRITKNRIKSEVIEFKQRSRELAMKQHIELSPEGAGNAVINIDIADPELPDEGIGHVTSPRSALSLYEYASPGVPTEGELEDENCSDSGSSAGSSMYDGSRVLESERQTNGDTSMTLLNYVVS